MSLKRINSGEYPHKMLIEVDEGGRIWVPTLDNNDKSRTIFGYVSPLYKDQVIVQDIQNISDGYHTFRELYHHRLLLTAMLFNSLTKNEGIRVFKSKKHYDDSMFEGYFITGIIFDDKFFSYHYPLTDWELFQVDEIERAPEWSEKVDVPIDELFDRFMLIEDLNWFVNSVK